MSDECIEVTVQVPRAWIEDYLVKDQFGTRVHKPDDVRRVLGEGLYAKALLKLGEERVGA